MPEAKVSNGDELIHVDLKQPGAAAFFAWLWPGAGHIYKGRYGKGILFMVCILTTYFFGLAIGGGHVVYASFAKYDIRWQYVCQLGVGIPALPAIAQNYQVRRAGKEPLFGGMMAPPRDPRPGADEQAEWHKRYHSFFELGTLYTMVAGLLNVLAIYDAYAGPFLPDSEDDKEKSPGDKNQGKSKG